MSQTGKTPSPGIYKVSEGVLINKDNTALAAYKKRKNREKRLDALENDIQDIKAMLEKILNGNK